MIKLRKNPILGILLILTTLSLFLIGCQEKKQERYQTLGKPHPTDYQQQIQNLINQAFNQVTYLAQAQLAVKDTKKAISYGELSSQTKTALKEVETIIDRLEKIEPPVEFENQYRTLLSEFIKLEGALEGLQSAAQKKDYALVRQYVDRALIVIDAISAAMP